VYVTPALRLPEISTLIESPEEFPLALFCPMSGSVCIVQFSVSPVSLSFIVTLIVFCVDGHVSVV